MTTTADRDGVLLLPGEAMFLAGRRLENGCAEPILVTHDGRVLPAEPGSTPSGPGAAGDDESRDPPQD